MNEEINDLALEVVKRGIFPHQRDKIEQLAKDADESPTTIQLIAKRMISITSYVTELKNSKRFKKVQIGCLQGQLKEKTDMINGLQREMEEYLPLPDQWRFADMRSIEAMKSTFIHKEVVGHPPKRADERPMEEVLLFVPPLSRDERETISEICRERNLAYSK